MNNYKLYERVIETFKSGDQNTANAAARNWIEESKTADFGNEEANELYWFAKNKCAVWRSGAINCRRAKVQMIEAVKKIAAMGLENPYDPSEPEPVVEVPADVEKPVNESVKAEETPAELAQVTKEKDDTKVYVLGVIPEKEETKEEPKEEVKEPVKEEPKEEEPEKKHLFGRSKKR